MTNQLLKYLYSQISKSTIQNNEKDSQNFERADKIIIWIVGFSIGIFVILFTQGYDLKNPNYRIISELSNQIAIVSLFVIILGLIFRIFSFFAQMLLTEINIEFFNYVDSFSNIPELPTPRTITDMDTIENIINYFEEDFGIKEKKPNFHDSTKQNIEEYRKLLVNYYTTLAEENNIEVQLNEFKNKISDYYGLSLKKINKQFTDGNRKVKFRGKMYRMILIGSYIFFFFTIGTFIAGTIIVLEKLLIR